MMLSGSECLSQSILALSVCFAATSPIGRALGKDPAEGFFFPSDMLYYNVF